MVLVRRSKKAVSEVSGMMYSQADLLGRCIERRPTGGVWTTHESVGECSKDAKMGRWNFTSHVSILSPPPMFHLPRYPHRYPYR